MNSHVFITHTKTKSFLVHTEDDTELSFEPGDIISDVETIDKAWWRGSSEDGRQGLFPANYVETI